MRPTGPATPADLPAALCRLFAWSLLWLTAAYLLNVALTFWGGLPGAASLWDDDAPFSMEALLQATFFLVAIGLAAAQVTRAPGARLRVEAARISDANATFIRGCFWAVLLVGVVDVFVTFLRFHDFLDTLAGGEIERFFAHQANRSIFVHAPLIVAGFAIAYRRRSLDFHWLALLVVLVELLVVILRAFYTYPTTYIADLARFWYSALFLLASAHTLLVNGHVRVDVVYAGLSTRGKGWVDAIGAIALGLTAAWTILIFGTWGEASAITGPILVFEKTVAEHGAYLKYLIAGLLGVFAASMSGQFLAQFLEAVADIRNEPNEHKDTASGAAM